MNMKIILFILLFSACSEHTSFESNTSKYRDIDLNRDTPDVVLEFKGKEYSDKVFEFNGDYERNYINFNLVPQNIKVEEKINAPKLKNITLKQTTKERFNKVNIANKDKSKVDIALIIDNSGSMRDELNSIKSKLAPLISELEQYDWKIGVTNMNMKDPCLFGIVSYSDGDENAIKNKFNSIVDKLIEGIKISGDERGTDRAIQALECNEVPKDKKANRKWVREDSFIAVIIVSDEDDYVVRNESKLVKYLNDKNESKTNVNGVLNLPASQCDLENSEDLSNLENTYLRAVIKTDGVYGCFSEKNAYTKIFSEISLKIKSDFPPFYILPEAPPYLDRISIYIDEVIYDGIYDITGNILSFEPLLTNENKIDIEYLKEYVPVKNSFNILPIDNKYPESVFIDGVLQPQTSFFVEDDKLIFSEMPLDFSIVSVKDCFKSCVFEHQLNPKALLKTLEITIDPEYQDIIWQNENILYFNYAVDNLVEINLKYLVEIGKSEAIKLGELGLVQNEIAVIEKIIDDQDRDLSYKIEEEKIILNENNLNQINFVKIQYIKQEEIKKILAIPNKAINFSLSQSLLNSTGCSKEQITISDSLLTIDCILTDKIHKIPFKVLNRTISSFYSDELKRKDRDIFVFSEGVLIEDYSLNDGTLIIHDSGQIGEDIVIKIFGKRSSI